MDGLAGFVFSLAVLLKSNLPVHAQSVEGSPSLNKRPSESGNKVRDMEHKRHST